MILYRPEKIFVRKIHATISLWNALVYNWTKHIVLTYLSHDELMLSYDCISSPYVPVFRILHEKCSHMN